MVTTTGRMLSLKGGLELWPKLLHGPWHLQHNKTETRGQPLFWAQFSLTDTLQSWCAGCTEK